MRLFGTNPLAADTDDDGLDDFDELNTTFTDPLVADTDGDDLDDGAENSLGTDPLDSDTDNDGLADGFEENVVGSDPLLADTDGGGLSDGAELRFELDFTDSTDDTGPDAPFFFDDMELGALDLNNWLSQDADVVYNSLEVSAGAFSLEFLAGATAETVAFDTTTCTTVGFIADLKNGPDRPEAEDQFVFSFFDGAAYQEFFTRDGGIGVTPFRRDSATIDAVGVSNASFAVLVENTGADLGLDSFFIDDMALFCDPDQLDDDGDGVANWEDCDDNDAAHTTDCGACVDDDDDGYGQDCDLGPDCNDSDPAVFPGAPDIFGDGIDSDCSNSDGPGLFDDFETGRPNITVWEVFQGPMAVNESDAVSGSFSIEIDGEGALETRTIDLSSCDTVAYSIEIADENAGTSRNFEVQYWDGGSWITIERTIGNDNIPFTNFSGNIRDADAFANMRMRLWNGAFNTNHRWRVDDFFVGCGDADGDGDLVDLTFDCDDTNDLLWFACDTCVDGDLDGYGVDCDLGLDCDDLDPLVNPGAIDVYGDGLDEDCSTSDGPGLSDDFEDGLFSPFVWDVNQGTFTETTFVFAGSSALVAEGGSVLETRSIDTTGCPTLKYSLWGGDAGLDAGEQVRIEYWDGFSWITIDQINDNEFAYQQYSGPIFDPNAFHTDFQMRLVSTADTRFGDAFNLDTFFVGCGGDDVDGDGVDFSDDCDDNDANFWFSCLTCVDGDGDARGDACDLGFDCDDADATVFTGAVDPLTDGLDVDCNGYDAPGLLADFDTGVFEPNIWSYTFGSAVVDPAFSTSGTHSLYMNELGAAETLAFDMSACTEVLWYYQGQRGPSRPGAAAELTLSYWDGSAWVVADTLAGGMLDDDFQLRLGVISDPLASGVDFAMRFDHNGISGNDDFYVDNFGFTCAGPDADGDGFPVEVDCNDADGNLWVSCDDCIDLDGDGYGEMCDLGVDCNDDDAGVFPGAADAIDGFDQNCDGVDGEALLSDDFELGIPDPAAFAASDGTVGIVTIPAASGGFAFNLGNAGQIDTLTVDASACTEVAYAFDYTRGDAGGVPEAFDDLQMNYDTGAGFVNAVTIPGLSARTPYQRAFGLLPAGANASTLTIRFANTTFFNGDDYYIDNFSIGCSGPDGDGDGYPSALDCDDTDGNQWASCAVCVDADLDGFGVDCDLGDDCDDTDGAIFPGQADAFGDGIDDDCSGADGEGYVDGFELGGPDPVVWNLFSITEPVYYTTLETSAGEFALELEAGASIQTNAMDTSLCTDIWYSIDAQSVGLDTFSFNDSLAIEYFDGTNWILADSLLPGSPDFLNFTASITDPLAFSATFQMRLVNTSDFTPGDAVRVDQFVVGCADADGDGDGFPPPVDCDDTNVNLWFSCDTCIDADGDGFGTLCDLPDDCDDGNALVFLGAVEPTLADGIDNNCSGVDGTDVVSDFETASQVPGFTAIVGTSFFSTDIAIDTTSLSMGSQGTTADILPIDTTGCGQLAWELQVLRGGVIAPGIGDSLALEGFNGVDWVQLWRLEGDFTSDLDFVRYSGSTGLAVWLGPNTLLRLNASGGSSGDFLVDEFAVGCDTDLDGLPDPAETVFYGTDVASPDSDADGVDDGGEINNGSDPLDPGSF